MPEEQRTHVLEQVSAFYRSARKAFVAVMVIGAVSFIAGIALSVVGDVIFAGSLMITFGHIEFWPALHYRRRLARHMSSVLQDISVSDPLDQEQQDATGVQRTLYQLYNTGFLILLIAVLAAVACVAFGFGLWMLYVAIVLMVHSGIVISFALVWRLKVGFYAHEISKL